MPFGHCSTAALDGDNEMKIILVVIAVIVAVIGIYKKDSWPLWATLGVSGLLLIGAIVQVAVEIREAKKQQN